MPSWESSCTGPPRRCPPSRRREARSPICWRRATRRHSRTRRTPSGTRTRCGSRRARSPCTMQRRTATRPYREFARDWEAGLAGWDPDEWATRFAATGARYVVLVTKHHDGYCLWPTRASRTRTWTTGRAHATCVGELAEAVRAAGMRFGVYYSGGLDCEMEPAPARRVLRSTARGPARRVPRVRRPRRSAS